MRELDRLLNRRKQEAARASGRRYSASGHRYYNAAALRAADHSSDVANLPVDHSQYAPIQVIDPTDPNFGLMTFMFDYSRWGGPDIWQ